MSGTVLANGQENSGRFVKAAGSPTLSELDDLEVKSESKTTWVHPGADEGLPQGRFSPFGKSFPGVEMEQREEKVEQRKMEPIVELKLFLSNPVIKARQETAATELATYILGILWKVTGRSAGRRKTTSLL